MSLSTGGLNRKEKTEELIKHHEQNFIMNGVENPVFIPKCAYQPRELNELHMGFFESELRKASDIYTECVSIQLDPEDPDRKLYKWRYNPHFAEEYPTTEPNANGHVRYLIPVSELIEIKIQADKDRIVSNFDGSPLVQVLNGRYGVFIQISPEKGKKINVKIPKDKDPKTLSRQDCLDLMENQTKK